MRQKIAQAAWDELIAVLPYANILSETETTIDDLGIEKSDFTETLADPAWDEIHEESSRVDFKEYSKVMKANGHLKPLRDDFDSLFDCATGKIPEGMSAIGILKLQERILSSLYEEHAFD